MPEHFANVMHAALARYVKAHGLRPTGRLLGDVAPSNTQAMRLHRLLHSPWTLFYHPFGQVILTFRTLGIPLPKSITAP